MNTRVSIFTRQYFFGMTVKGLLRTPNNGTVLVDLTSRGPYGLFFESVIGNNELWKFYDGKFQFKLA